MATTTAPPTPTMSDWSTSDRPDRRRRRARHERAAYVAATPILAVGPQLDAVAWPLHLTVTAIGAVTLARIFRKARPTEREQRRRERERLELEADSRLGLLRTCYRATPTLTGAALYFALLAVPVTGTDIHPVAQYLAQYGAPAAWGAAMAAAIPRTRAPRRKRRTSHELRAELGRLAGLPDTPLTPGSDQERERRLPTPRTFSQLVAWHWEHAGIATGCYLTRIQQIQPGSPDFRAALVAPHGKTVPPLSPAALAAVWDMPEGAVTLEPLAGHGPGHKLLTARPTLTPTSPDGEENRPIDPQVAALWRTHLAKPGGPLQGVTLLETKTDEPNRIALRVRAAGDEVLRLPHKAIARALGIDDMELVVCQTNQMGDGIVSIYETHPLLTIREATVEDLTMNDRGEVAFGLQHDGRLARINLYKPGLGATNDLFVGAPGSGKSVGLNTLLIAERINGVVSIVADAQDGMSLPEANGRVAHFGAGIAAVPAVLAATYAVARHRQQISSANGWGSFTINDPWPLVIVTLDELNLVLAEEAEADIPPTFKTWVLGLISKFQITGRKMGIGIRFAAQGIHAADLGDKVKLRANAKTGTVWLGRTTSGTTSHMATEGILPPGVDLIPIPEAFGEDDVDAAFHGADTVTGPTTAGMANLIRQGRLTRMRVWRAEKDHNRQYPHLIRLFEHAPIPHLTPKEQEIFDTEYTLALGRAEQILAGEPDATDDDEHADDGLDDILAKSAPAPTPPLRDRILAVVEEHGQIHRRDLAAAISGAAPESIYNAAGELCNAGKLHRAGRGFYTLPQ